MGGPLGTYGAYVLERQPYEVARAVKAATDERRRNAYRLPVCRVESIQVACLATRRHPPGGVACFLPRAQCTQCHPRRHA